MHGGAGNFLRSMVKHIAFLFIICSCSFAQAKDVTGRTFFGVRPQFQSTSPERITFFREHLDLKEGGRFGGVEVVPFGGSSVKSDKLARYFMFNGKTELLFAGDCAFGDGALALEPGLRDVNVIHFNIGTPLFISGGPGTQEATRFKSIVSFKPRHTFIGTGLVWKQLFGCDHTWWWEVGTSVQHIRNCMNLTENILEPINITLDTQQYNSCVEEAFRGIKPLYTPNVMIGNSGFAAQTGEGWVYGKIDGTQSNTKVADVELKLGKIICDKEQLFADAYIGFTFPVGNKPTAEYVFPAGISLHHAGVMFTPTVRFRCTDSFAIECKYALRYAFDDVQTRSFDLKGKPWSRYMMVYRSQQDAHMVMPTEGINVFTKAFKIRAGFFHRFNTACIFEHKHLQAELGYNIWMRNAEQIQLREPWQETVGLVSLSPTGFARNRISRADQIGEAFNTPEPFTQDTTITEQDLDLETATIPCAVSHTVYFAANYKGSFCDFPTSIGIGASYEFSDINTALTRWTVWTKAVISV